MWGSEAQRCHALSLSAPAGPTQWSGNPRASVTAAP
jgi:hypothetical protein